MTLILAQTAAKHAEHLLEILREIGAVPVALQGVERGVVSLWEVLEYLATPGDPSDSMVSERYVISAGIHDLAAKITAVWDNSVEARPQLTPHLKLLAETYYVGQNTANVRWDRIGGVPREHGSADKVIELYWACLCLLAQMSVKLDDPYASSGGMNPDVIATAADGTTWAFALKTLAQGNPANTAKNLSELIGSAFSQIRRAGCEKGVAVVNLKNVINHEKLLAIGTFRRWEDGQAVLQSQIEALIQQFYSTEASLLDASLESKSVVAPVVILVAHTTILCYPPGSLKRTFTELKSMTAMTLPDRLTPAPGTFAAEVVGLATAMNDIVHQVV